jgi:hypothetical protein
VPKGVLSGSAWTGTRSHIHARSISALLGRALIGAARILAPDGTYFSACKDCNVNVFAHRRRARLAAADGSFTTAEWEALRSQYDHCPDCGRRWADIPPPPGRSSVITRDHIVAISKGDRNDISNLRPLCYSCNSRKGDRSRC